MYDYKCIKALKNTQKGFKKHQNFEHKARKQGYYRTTTKKESHSHATLKRSAIRLRTNN